MAYNNVFRILFGYRRSCSASEMFVTNDIYNFEGRMRKHINDFTMRVGSSSNILHSFIHAGSGHRLTVQYSVLCTVFCVF